MKHIKKLSLNLFVYFTLFALMTFSVFAAQSAVNLGTAGDFVILSKSGISTTGTTLITGNIGTSPIDSTAITGFGLILDASNEFASSSLVTGKVYASDYTAPTPSIMTTAISDMETAYTDAAGRTETSIITEIGAGDISGMTLAPGLYKWGTGVLINNGVTLSGDANDIWIFQIAQDLTVGNGAIITLNGGAQAKNIFWQVGGQTTIGTTSDFKGVILCQTLIEMQTGATLKGRALAQTAVTLDANAVTAPISSSIPTTNIDNENIDNEDNGESNTGGSVSGNEYQCGEWSACNSEGISTKICKYPNNTTLTKRQSCDKPTQTPTQTNAITQKNNKTNTIDTNKIIDNGIGQELNQQVEARREEIRSGDYNGSFGQLMNVRELALNLKELRVNGILAQTNLTITAETDSNGKTKLKTKLRNGTEIEIKIMPDTASEKALERLRVKVCSPDNNCTIQLKGVGSNKTEKIQYEVQLERHSRILGIFQKKMIVRADVDAHTGDIKLHNPWWAFIATEQAE